MALVFFMLSPSFGPAPAPALPSSVLAFLSAFPSFHTRFLALPSFFFSLPILLLICVFRCKYSSDVLGYPVPLSPMFC